MALCTPSIAYVAPNIYRASLPFGKLPNRLASCAKPRSQLPQTQMPNVVAVSKCKVSPIPSPQSVRFASSFFVDPLLVRLQGDDKVVSRTKGSRGGALSSRCAVVVSTETLRWIVSASAVLLMLLKNTAINKAFIVPLLALQAPSEVISWIRGEYGMWAAFLGLLVRIFYYIPGELELPLLFLLLLISAPYQVMDFRGTTAAIILCAAIAAYLAYQHFSRTGGLQGAFREGAFVASIAVVFLACIPFIFLVQAV